MRFLLPDHLTTALLVIKSNKMRSFLTTLGIAIGIASITTILSLTAGVKLSIQRQTAKIDDRLAIIRTIASAPAESDFLPRISQSIRNNISLPESDVSVISRVDSSLRVAPIMTLSGTAATKDTTLENQMIIATTPALLDTINLSIEHGQFFEEGSNANLAVIGSRVAMDLFGVEDPVGQLFTLRQQRFTVIGVIEEDPTVSNYLDADFNKLMIVPLGSGKLLNQGQSAINQINISAPSGEELSAHLDAIKQAIQKNHSGEKDFELIYGRLADSPTGEAYRLIENAMTVIAVIALVIGGIGVMNIMLVSVSERTREIGIRKSVGASNGNILVQFLIESLLISLTGGAAGVVLGVVAAYTVGASLDLSPYFTWQVGLVSFGMSLVIGVIFGLYPAIKASRKDPIESLRQFS